MPLTIVPREVFDELRDDFTEAPPEFASFLKKMDSTLKPLTYRATQRAPLVPQVKAVMTEVLNRMTTTNVQEAIDTILKLSLKTVEDLETVVDYLFTYMLYKQEIKMSMAYAELVKGIKNIKMDDKKLQKLLLSRCHKEFLEEMKYEYVVRGTGDAEEDKICMELEHKLPLNEAYSAAYRKALSQFIASMGAIGILSPVMIDTTILELLSICINGGEEDKKNSKTPEKVDVRAQMTSIMIQINAPRYKANATDPQIKEIVRLVKEIMGGKDKYPHINSRTRFSMSDTYKLIVLA
jgi:hypothetical protein